MKPSDPETRQSLEIQRLREIIAHNSDWIWEVDDQGRYTFCSEHSRHMLGYAPHEVLGHTPFDFMPADEALRVGAQFAAIVAERRAFSGLINRNLRADGRLVILETSGVPLFDSDGRFIGYRGIDRDVSPSIGPLNLRAVQLEALYAAAPVALGLLDREGRVVNANHALAALLDAEAANLAGAAFNDLLPIGLLDVATAFARLDAGETLADQELDWRERSYQVAVQGVRDLDGSIIGMTLALTDVTEQRRTRQQLAEANARLGELAEKDYLTGLPNRRRFDETLLTEVGRALREGSSLSLLILDVDHFKAYNDHYGHQQGDQCLRLLARLLRDRLFRPADLACRYGGEEFAVILPQTDAVSAAEVAERLRQQVYTATLQHQGACCGRITISIGIATLSSLPPTRTTLLPARLAALLVETADRSLYAAKRNGRNQVRQAHL